MTKSLEHVYTPRGACAEVFNNRHEEVLISGPAGTGKSRACLEKLHMTALLNPGMRGLITRKNQTSLGSTALQTWRRFVIPEALATGEVKYYGGSKEKPAQYVYKNGSSIMVGGLDQPIKIMSSEYDMVYIQEATELNEEDWESVTTRLRNWIVSFQQLIADCNPNAPTHWLKKRCDSGKTILLHSRHEDNPMLFNENGELTEDGALYIKKLDKLSGVRYKRLRLGLWVSAEGMVYEEFDEALHLLDPSDIPPDWTRYWVIDFGFTNPFVWQAWAEDHDGCLFHYREIYKTETLVEDHARHILKLTEGEPRPREIICDHDAEGRATLERYLGMSTNAAIKNVSEGIQAVQKRLKPAGDGYARIYFLKDALVARDPELEDHHKPCSTVEEFPGYIWDENSRTEERKEEPVKIDDHGMDCTRYLVAARDLGARPRVRFMYSR